MPVAEQALKYASLPLTRATGSQPHPFPRLSRM
jgi:hypothetical protein